MPTPLEYLEDGIPASHELWLNGLDIVKHCLQKDSQQTFFKTTRPATRHWNDWSEAMSKRAENDDNFQDIYDNAYIDKNQWETVDNDSGLLDVGQFIAGEELCFDEDVQVYETGDCMSVLIDIAIPYCERSKSYMIERHKLVYDLIAQCDSEERPIQVIGVLGVKVDELPTPLKIFIVVKEYNDTIFPAIWGTLINNEVCNSFINVIMDYFIGTHDCGNGSPRTVKDAEIYLPEQEELHIFGTRITSQYNANKGA